MKIQALGLRMATVDRRRFLRAAGIGVRSDCAAKLYGL